ncbi:MAG: hypothetical protein ABSG54_09230, partial [Terriglobia bacterium]
CAKQLMWFIERSDEQLMNLDRRDMPILFRMLLSLLIIGLCIYLLLREQSSNDYAKWAFGMIGVVIGYWLK